MGLIAKALNRSLHLACRRRRNYIIDQTNVSKEARRRKLSQFKDFQVTNLFLSLLVRYLMSFLVPLKQKKKLLQEINVFLSQYDYHRIFL